MDNKFIPVGFVTGWTRTVEEIPAGWALCDSKNGTYDLREKFDDKLLIQKIKTKEN